eukprot:5043_1
MATEDSTPPLIDAVHEDASSESIHRAHHRKNSTKTGFWGQADKIPPAGTKAYWLYLQQKADLSADFALPLRVKSWDHHEIAYWLRKIKFDKYAVAFIEEKVTGEQLIYDMNSTVLSSDLGVKILHCGKIMGEIKSLKILAGIVDEKEEMYEARIEKLLEQIIEKEKIIKQAEQDGFIMDSAYATSDSADITDDTPPPLIDAFDKQQTMMYVDEQDPVEPISRPAQLDKLRAENDRLAQQVDEYEEKIHHMKTAAVPEQKRTETLERLAVFNKELQQMKHNDKSFGDVRRVRQWNTNEVCWFFHSIGFEDYVNTIKEEKLNGEILIQDMSPELLSRDIGVKRIHINQILRHIVDLKRKAFGYEEDDNVIDTAYVPEEYATDKYASYVAIIKEKDAMNGRLQQQTEDAERVNRQLKDEMNDIKQVSANQQSQILMLNDECKENKIELQELKLRYKELQKNSKLDERRYAEWSMEDVLHWIMRLDDGKRFVKYEKKVHKALTEQEFDGSCLEDVEKSDVADWGVTNFKDKTFLFKQIQNMTQQNVQKEENIKENMNVAIADHEGNVSGGHYR